MRSVCVRVNIDISPEVGRENSLEFIRRKFIANLDTHLFNKGKVYKNIYAQNRLNLRIIYE